MSSQQQKPKSVGSAYLNVSKDATDELKNELAGIIQFLTENKAYLSISILRADGQYAKLTGFFNEFKRNDKDPDIMIRNSVKATQTRQGNGGGYAKKSWGGNRGGYQKPAGAPTPAATAPQQAQGDEFGGEGVPF